MKNDLLLHTDPNKHAELVVVIKMTALVKTRKIYLDPLHMTQEFNVEIKDCACGKDHETMPMIDISTCCCVWAGEDPDCDHSSIWVEGVCREHKKHEPCRPCMRSKTEE